jgi:hypothetical protein
MENLDRTARMPQQHSVLQMWLIGMSTNPVSLLLSLVISLLLLFLHYFHYCHLLPFIISHQVIEFLPHTELTTAYWMAK